MWNQKPSYRFEIDNFSEKKTIITSQVFVSGGCKWCLNLYPKGDGVVKLDDHLSLYVNVANPKSLGSGWKRIANFYFVLLNQSDKELYRSPIGGQESTPFCAESPSWGWRYFLSLSKFQKTGLLEDDRLIIEVYINIVEAFDGEEEDVSSEKEETVDINGFHVVATQVTHVQKIFAEHPDLAEDLKVKNQVVKTVYMNVLLNLIETLNKLSQNHSETELRNAHSELSELVEVGFKLDWLKLKLNEVSLKRKKADVDVKKLELVDLDFKMDPLKTKIEEVPLERKKSDDADWSRVQQLEERLKNLELMELDLKLDCLKSKLEEVSLEKKKADAGVQQLEESVKNLVIMVSDLKVELDNEKAKSSADGFLLVD
ncbi:unnamed protein product [Arabidopsis halleri]